MENKAKGQGKTSDSESGQQLALRDVMSSDTVVVSPSTSLFDCAQQMRDHDVGALPVCDNDRLVGMVTDRDLVVRAVSENLEMKSTTAQHVMTKPISYCFEDDSIEEVSQMMRSKQIRRVVVLNREKRLVGMVSLGDLAAKTGDESLSGHILEKVSQPTKGVAA